MNFFFCSFDGVFGLCHRVFGHMLYFVNGIFCRLFGIVNRVARCLACIIVRRLRRMASIISFLYCIIIRSVNSFFSVIVVIIYTVLHIVVGLMRHLLQRACAVDCVFGRFFCGIDITLCSVPRSVIRLRS